MRTLLFSIVGIGTLLFAGWLVLDTYVLGDHDAEPDSYTSVTFPEIPLVPNDSKPAERVVATEKGEVRMRDVRTLAYAVPIGEGMYSYRGTAQQPDSGFDITYSERNDSFAISIFQRPLEQYHEYASRYFLEMTELNETDACKLNVFVSVPYDVNEDFAGRDFNLAYCADAVTMRE